MALYRRVRGLLDSKCNSITSDNKDTNVRKVGGVNINDYHTAFQMIKEDVLKEARTGHPGVFSGPSDVFVLTAEVALEHKDAEGAGFCLEIFFSRNPARDQFLCRGHLAQAMLEHHYSSKTRGDLAKKRVLKAVVFTLNALDVAKKISWYSFLVYNCSVVFWRVARRFIYDADQTTRISLTNSLKIIVKSLEDSNDPNLQWRTRLLMTLSRCYEDLKNQSEAIFTAQQAFNLSVKAKDLISSSSSASASSAAAASDQTIINQDCSISLSSSASSYYSSNLLNCTNSLRKEAFRLLVHLSVQSADSSNRLRQDTIAGPTKDLRPHFQLQQVLSSSGKELSKFSTELKDCVSSGNLINDEFIAEVARAAINKGVCGIVRDFLKMIENSRNAKARCLYEYALAELAVYEVKRLDEEKHPDRCGAEPESLLKTREDALLRLRVTLDVALHADGSDGNCSDRIGFPSAGLLVEEGAALIWNIGLPLLQYAQYPGARKAFQHACDCMESIDSNILELRAHLHYGAMQCYLLDDTLARAHVHVLKAIQLTCSDTFLLELEKYRRNIELRTSIYNDKETFGVLERAYLLIEQAKGSKVGLRLSLLQKALGYLKSNELTMSKERLLLLADLISIPFDEEETLRDLIQQGCVFFASSDWKSIACFDLECAAVQVFLVLARCYSDQLKQKQNGEFGIVDTSVLFHKKILGSLMHALGLAVKIKEAADIHNVVITLWNTYLPLIIKGSGVRIVDCLMECNRGLSILDRRDIHLSLRLGTVLASALEKRAHMVHKQTSSAYRENNPWVKIDASCAEICRKEFLDAPTSSHAQSSFPKQSTVHRSLDPNSDLKVAEDLLRSMLLLQSEVDAKKETLFTLARIMRKRGTYNTASLKLDAKGTAFVNLGALMFENDAKRKNDHTNKILEVLDQFPPDMEIFGKLALESFESNEFELIVGIGRKAVETVESEKNRNPDASLVDIFSQNSLRWLAVCVCHLGQSLVRLSENCGAETISDQQVVEAVCYMAQASTYALLSREKPLVLYICQTFKNLACSFFEKAPTFRSVLLKPTQEILKSVLEAGYSASECVAPLYKVLFQIMKEQGLYAEGNAAVEEAFKYLPRKSHQILWEAKVIFSTNSSKQLSPAVFKSKENDPILQNQVYLLLARSCMIESDRRKWYNRSLDVLARNPLERVEVLIEYAGLLFHKNHIIDDVRKLLHEAAFILHCHDDSGIDFQEKKRTLLRSSKIHFLIKKQKNTTDDESIDNPEVLSNLSLGQLFQLSRVYFMLAHTGGGVPSGDVDSSFAPSKFIVTHLLLARDVLIRFFNSGLPAGVEPPASLGAWSSWKIDDSTRKHLSSEMQKSIPLLNGRLLLDFIYALIGELKRYNLHLFALALYNLCDVVLDSVFVGSTYGVQSMRDLNNIAWSHMLAENGFIDEALEKRRSSGSFVLSPDVLEKFGGEIRNKLLFDKIAQKSHHSRVRESAAASEKGRSLLPGVYGTINGDHDLWPVWRIWLEQSKHLIKEGSYSLAKALLLEAGNHSKVYGDLFSHSWCQFLISVISFYENDSEKAMSCILKCEGVSLGTLAFWRKSVIWLAKIHRFRKEYRPSSTILRHAIDVFEKVAVENPNHLLSVLNSLGSLKHQLAKTLLAEVPVLNEHKIDTETNRLEALHCFRDALDTFKVVGGRKYIKFLKSFSLSMLDKSLLAVSDVSAEQRLIFAKDHLRGAESTLTETLNLISTDQLVTTISMPVGRELASIQTLLGHVVEELAMVQAETAPKPSRLDVLLNVQHDSASTMVKQSLTDAFGLCENAFNLERFPAKRAIILANMGSLMIRLQDQWNIFNKHTASFDKSVVPVTVTDKVAIMYKTVPYVAEATGFFLRSLDLARKNNAPTTALKAAAKLVDIFGSSPEGQGRVLQYILTAQICEVAVEVQKLVKNTLRAQHPSRLCLELRERLSDRFFATRFLPANGIVNDLLKRSSLGKIYDRILCWDYNLQGVPGNTTFVSLWADPDFEYLYLAAGNRENTVTNRMAIDREQYALLEKLLKKFDRIMTMAMLEASKKPILDKTEDQVQASPSKFACLQKSSGSTVSKRELRPSGEAGKKRAAKGGIRRSISTEHLLVISGEEFDESTLYWQGSLDAKGRRIFAELEKQLQFFLEPLLSVMNAINMTSRCVILPCMEFAKYPLETLPFLDAAESVTRDFSISFLVYRNKDSISGATAQQQKMRNSARIGYLVDPLNQDHIPPCLPPNLKDNNEQVGGAVPEAGSKPKKYQTICELFDQRFLSKSRTVTVPPNRVFEGLIGSSHPPSIEEVQNILLRSSIFFYIGFGSIFEYFDPTDISAIDLSELQSLVLIDRAVCQENLPSSNFLSLSASSYHKALFFSLTGINEIVLNQWDTTGRFNGLFGSDILEEVITGHGITDAVEVAKGVTYTRNSKRISSLDYLLYNSISYGY